MKNVPIVLRLALVALLALICTQALAQNGLEVGVAAYPSDTIVANVHVSLPLFETNDVQHAVRADVAYAFEGAPGVSASYVLSGAPEDNALERYLGAGAGLAFPEAPASSPLISAHGLVGLRVPLTSHLHAFTEGIVAANGFGSDLAVGIGVAYTFGGSN